MRPASAKAVRSALAIRKTGAQTEDARRPREGEGRRAGGWPDVSRKGEATTGWGKRSKGKEGEGRSACPSRDRRRCSSFPIPAQRGGVRLMHAEGIVARGRPASSEGAPSQRRQTGQRGAPETPTTAAEAPTTTGLLPLATGCRWRWRGLPPTCDAPRRIRRFSVCRRSGASPRLPPPAPQGHRGGGGVRRFAERLSTAGTRSIPAGGSAP